jgi:hypothetical protein
LKECAPLGDDFFHADDDLRVDAILGIAGV